MPFTTSNFQFGDEKLDQRGRKYYARHVYMRFDVHGMPHSLGYDRIWSLRQLLEQHMGCEKNPTGHTFRGVTSYYCHWHFKVAKPSLIPDASACFAELGGQDLLKWKAAVIFGAALGALHRQDNANKQGRYIEWVRKHYIEDLEAEAKAACRYKQRIAALNAEVQAEFEVRLGSVDRDKDYLEFCDALDNPDFELDRRAYELAVDSLKGRDVTKTRLILGVDNTDWAQEFLK